MPTDLGAILANQPPPPEGLEAEIQTIGDAARLEVGPPTNKVWLSLAIVGVVVLLTGLIIPFAQLLAGGGSRVAVQNLIALAGGLLAAGSARRLGGNLRIDVNAQRIEFRRRHRAVRRVRRKDLVGVTLVMMPIDYFARRAQDYARQRPCTIIRFAVAGRVPTEIDLSPAWTDRQIDWLARVLAAVLDMDLKVKTE